VEAELEYYKGIREEILAMTIDTIEYSNQALKDGKSILIEGANATSTYSLSCLWSFFSIVLKLFSYRTFNLFFSFSSFFFAVLCVLFCLHFSVNLILLN
jgi:hypothetical protein